MKKTKTKRKRLDVELFNKRGVRLAGANMPLNMDNNKEMAIMWYFISWHNKLKDWSFKDKRPYAKELSNICAHIPIHIVQVSPSIVRDLPGTESKQDFQPLLDSMGVKLFKYSNGTFSMLNRKGEVLYDVTSLNLYALLVYFVDSMHNVGLKDHEGFGFVRTAKLIIKRDDEHEKKKK